MAWILENESGTQMIMGNCVVTGYGLDQSAYGSEIYGLYTMVLLVYMIKEVWGLTKGDILLGCNVKDDLIQSININKQ